MSERKTASGREPPKAGLVNLPLRSRRRAEENLSLFGGEVAGARDPLSPLPLETTRETGMESEQPSPPEPTVLQLDFDELDESDAEAPFMADAPSLAAAAAVLPAEAAVKAPGVIDHFLAGLADAAANLGVTAAAVVGMSLLGLEPGLDQWPGFLAFLLIFSFFYHTVPLAFWGRTAGMAWQGLRARDVDGRPLTFRQTAIRWVASWLAAALAGSPALVAWSGRSFPDRLSGSRTFAG